MIIYKKKKKGIQFIDAYMFQEYTQFKEGIQFHFEFPINENE